MRLVFVVMMLAALPARADNNVEALAQGLMGQGERFFSAGNYDTAVRMFSAASALVPERPGPYLWLGLTYAAADKCSEAVTALEEYLRRKSGDEAKPEALRALALCKAVAKHEPPKPAHKQKLRVVSVPPGAKVRLDDAAVPGVAPLSLDVTDGEHTLQVAAVSPATATTATVKCEPPAIPPGKPLTGLTVYVAPLRYRLANNASGLRGDGTMEGDESRSDIGAGEFEEEAHALLGRVKSRVRELGGSVVTTSSAKHTLEIATELSALFGYSSEKAISLRVHVTGWVNGQLVDFGSAGHPVEYKSAEADATAAADAILAADKVTQMVRQLRLP